MTEVVKSPCISVCALNDDDVCIGCMRTVEEITGWRSMTERERAEVMERVRHRQRENNPFAG
ncbi:DUF1289 domain-containing protein [Simiduia agarivorans]|uniref:Fe-S protein n=1 Tax=Simiduia agarivorans (strain DSM 21679 / JCM 13881 / BCRC 17597 / SA1) TaxID=1117647 RepID=R9S5L9_SIMAS|nr:DUF1289 domain-containing protein [Simiduia agarivorans]AGN11289.1 Fe-S protein [Simiduia agarivorans SA1 = DSM 21679]